MIELNKIYNEDCLITMDSMQLKSVDCVLTSPPYNLTDDSISGTDKKKGQLRYDIHKDNMSENEYLQFTEEVFSKYDLILKDNGVVLYNMSYGKSNPNLMSLTVAHILKYTPFVLQDIIVWKKPIAMPSPASNSNLRRVCEFVYVFVRKSDLDTFKMNKQIVKTLENGMNYYEVIDNYVEAKNNDGSNTLNKATFSTELVTKLLKMYVPVGSTVYDSFMGTGTTALACIDYGAFFIGSEMSKEQCDYAINRTTENINKLPLFDDYTNEHADKVQG